MEPIQIMVDDLGRQVAQKAIESAEWKARALVAEQALATAAAISNDAGEVPGSGLTLVTDADADDEGEG